MTDAVYAFTEEGFRNVQRATRDVLRAPKGAKRRRQPPVLSGAGGGSKIVVFTIDSYTDPVIDEETDEVTEPGFATCTVRYTPCGVSVPGRDDNGKITVYDPMGCMFNEEAADLADRWGHAAWMKPTPEEAVENGEADAYGEYPVDCRWVVLGLCCPPE